MKNEQPVPTELFKRIYKRPYLRLISLIFICISTMVQAQIPDGYYDGAAGLSGYALKTKLSQITGDGYISHSYNDLWQAFELTDEDAYYEDDGTVLDVYSENPDGSDPYEYTFSSDQCGNYSEEGDCYNREHLVPQSWFDEQYPMKADIHHIFPVDGYVNSIRSNYPFGEVDNATYTSQNGSKKGPNSYDYTGAYTGTVFEPIDEFKGDIARTYLYMAMRYEDEIGSWENASSTSAVTFDGSSDHVFTDWMLDLLLKWNDEDPVSQREIDRNNAAYEFQGNRNPFIDHPEYAHEIWGDSDDNPSSEPIIFENFDQCDGVSDNFVAVSELSDQDWHCITDHGEDNSGAMQMNGFADGQQVPSKDWLITVQPIDFDNYTDEKLSLYTEATFGETPLDLVYSTDYDGSGLPSDFTWQDVPNINIANYPQGESDPIVQTFSEVDISSIEDNQAYIALRYDNSHGEGATRWTIDNFKITGTETMGVNPHQLNGLSLYPNPVSQGPVTIDLDQTDAFEYTVYTINGKKIKEGHSKTDRLILSTDGLESGLYLIKIDGSHRSATARLVVE